MNRCELSDQELVNSYFLGNETSLEILINRHRSRVFSYLLMVVKDRFLAEDLFQDTFIKVINTIKSGSYKEEGKFIQWVMRIAHNLTIDHFRKSKRFPTVESGENQDIFETLNMMDPSVEDRMVTDQIHRDVRKLIEYLPSEQKEVLMMRHYGDLSFKEIADKTDVSINTALGRMRYALINLRKLVAQHQVILSS